MSLPLAVSLFDFSLSTLWNLGGTETTPRCERFGSLSRMSINRCENLLITRTREKLEKMFFFLLVDDGKSVCDKAKLLKALKSCSFDIFQLLGAVETLKS